ncbi:protein TILLER ANGLE CONTROL 1-like [Salvia splendens]|uniref:protein TILLER ANGLE CONTROL 1-like n=1 Tax=Salvia splendens TaxID=180675 RepID=UPI001C26B81F|nr:protein TILLER ANGLE CONTROL 1-like [Salvia splendens]
MKIFNWVHRRFNNKAENVKKNSDIATTDEQQFVGENECDVVLESWRGGILAIGTFGYDPLKHKNQHLTEAYFSEDVDDDDDDGDNDGDDSSSLIDQRGGNPLALTENVEEEEEDGELEFGFEYVMMKKKERTTLADLFVADCDEDECGIAKSKSHHLLTQKSSRKHTPSFGRTARPIHKLNKLMRRMLTRKIHPELVGPTNPKLQALDNYDYNYNYSYNYANKTRETDDYASLLPTKDINI